MSLSKNIFAYILDKSSTLCNLFSSKELKLDDKYSAIMSDMFVGTDVNVYAVEDYDYCIYSCYDVASDYPSVKFPKAGKLLIPESYKVLDLICNATQDIIRSVSLNTLPADCNLQKYYNPTIKKFKIGSKTISIFLASSFISNFTDEEIKAIILQTIRHDTETLQHVIYDVIKIIQLTKIPSDFWLTFYDRGNDREDYASVISLATTFLMTLSLFLISAYFSTRQFIEIDKFSIEEGYSKELESALSKLTPSYTNRHIKLQCSDLSKKALTLLRKLGNLLGKYIESGIRIE